MNNSIDIYILYITLQILISWSFLNLRCIAYSRIPFWQQYVIHMHAFISPFDCVSVCATELSKGITAQIGMSQNNRKKLLLSLMIPKKQTKTNQLLDVKTKQGFFKMERRELGRKRPAVGAFRASHIRIKAAASCAPQVGPLLWSDSIKQGAHWSTET